MSFEAPLFLLGLAAIPVAAWLYVRFERRRADGGRDAFALAPVLPSVAPRRAGWRRHAPIAVYGLALAVLVVALARPTVTVAVPVEDATVVLVTDHSGSMQADDVEPTRLDATKRAAERFLDAAPSGVRTGAVAFNHAARALTGPTRDRESVRSALRSLQPSGGTATGDALATALRIANPDARDAPAAIVLLSDGTSTRGRDPLAVAREAREAGVAVHTVAVGTDAGTIEVPRRGGGTTTQPVPPDSETLRRVAEITGGQSFSATSAERLEEVYDRLGTASVEEREPREQTAAAAGLGLLLVMAGGALSLRWAGRLP
jgi:Ca-activated chloride channel family protein